MSSTEYLDKVIMNDKGMIVKDVMDSIKLYCGLFGFISSVCNADLSKEVKERLITNIIESSLAFMTKKYEANLQMYTSQISKSVEKGNKFNALSIKPAKMREDFEMGLEEAKKYLYIETRDILKILNSDLEV